MLFYAPPYFKLLFTSSVVIAPFSPAHPWHCWLQTSSNVWFSNRRAARSAHTCCLSVAASGSVASGWLCHSWETWILIICSCQEQHKEHSFISFSTVSLNTHVQVPWKSLLAASFGWNKTSCDLYSASCGLLCWYTERHPVFKICTQHSLTGVVIFFLLLYPLLPSTVVCIPP